MPTCEYCGLAFAEGDAVGLRPLDGRETDWLDPHVLYRLHDQTVALRLELAATG